MNNVGFDIVFRKNEINIKIKKPASESKNKTPLIDFFISSSKRLMCIFYGRIYYYDKYPWTKLSHPNDQKYKKPAQNIANLYSQTSLREVKNVIGDYTTVIWDAEKGKFFLLRDILGCGQSIYYSQQNGFIYISSDLHFVSNQSNNDSYDEYYLSNYLLQRPCNEVRSTNHTPYINCYKVLPNTTVELTASNKYIYTNQELKSNIPNRNSIKLEEASEGLLAALKNSIAERLTNHTACHFSGGMDSTLVLSLAASMLKNSNEKILTAVSALYKEDTLQADISYIQQGKTFFLKKYPDSIRYHEVNASVQHDFKNYLEYDLNEPCGPLYRFPVFHEIVNQAHKLKCDTILSGQFSEPIVEGNLYYISDLLRNFKILSALKLCFNACKHGGEGTKETFKQYGLKPILPRFIDAGFRGLTSGYGIWPNLSNSVISPWINKTFSRKVKLNKILKNLLKRKYTYPYSLNFYFDVINSDPGGSLFNHHVATPNGIHCAHPFLDKYVIEFCLSIPNNIKYKPRTRKPFLKFTAANDLPYQILNRRTKSGYSQFFLSGLKKQSNLIRNLIRQSSFFDTGIFDKHTFSQCFEEALEGRLNVLTYDHIKYSLALIAWHESKLRSNASSEHSQKSSNISYFNITLPIT